MITVYFGENFYFSGVSNKTNIDADIAPIKRFLAI